MGSSWMLLFCCFLLSFFAVACCSLWHAGAGACFLCLPCHLWWKLCFFLPGGNWNSLEKP